MICLDSRRSLARADLQMCTEAEAKDVHRWYLDVRHWATSYNRASLVKHGRENKDVKPIEIVNRPPGFTAMDQMRKLAKRFEFWRASNPIFKRLNDGKKSQMGI